MTEPGVRIEPPGVGSDSAASLAAPRLGPGGLAGAVPGAGAAGGGAAGRRPVSRYNVANLLTFFRLVLVVPFVLALFADGGHQLGWRIVATALFVAAALTDKLDGTLARRYGWVTELGKFADPLADKALTGAALIGLSLLHLVPWWLTVLVVVREVVVTVLRSVLARIAVIPASRGGKLKTLLLSVGLGLVLLPFADHGVVHGIGIAVLVAAAVVSTATGVDYVLAGRRLRRTGRSPRG